METKTPAIFGMRRVLGALACLAIPQVTLAAALLVVPIMAFAAGPATVKGKAVGIAKLLNPVWEDARDPALHRYTFREQSATVRADVRTLTGFLPKELCIAALVEGEGKALRAPLRVVVAGGRTSPVMLVVAPGQQLQFDNQDPFPHKLYVVGADSKGLGPVDMAPAKTRGWTPPGPGKYEIRDQLAPSLRSWIVVEPHVSSVGYPDRKGDFQIDLEPGSYKLRGFFKGEPVGVELPVLVAPVPAEQPLKAPLVVGEVDAAASPKPGMHKPLGGG